MPFTSKRNAGRLFPNGCTSMHPHGLISGRPRRSFGPGWLDHTILVLVPLMLHALCLIIRSCLILRVQVASQGFGGRGTYRCTSSLGSTRSCWNRLILIHMTIHSIRCTLSCKMSLPIVNRTWCEHSLLQEIELLEVNILQVRVIFIFLVWHRSNFTSNAPNHRPNRQSPWRSPTKAQQPLPTFVVIKGTWVTFKTTQLFLYEYENADFRL